MRSSGSGLVGSPGVPTGHPVPVAAAMGVVDGKLMSVVEEAGKRLDVNLGGYKMNGVNGASTSSSLVGFLGFMLVPNHPERSLTVSFPACSATSRFAQRTATLAGQPRYSRVLPATFKTRFFRLPILRIARSCDGVISTASTNIEEIVR